MRFLIYSIYLKLCFITSSTVIAAKDNLNLISDVHNFYGTSFSTFLHFSGSQKEILSTNNDLCSVKRVRKENLKLNITTTTLVECYNKPALQKWYLLNKNPINGFELRNWKSRFPFLKSTDFLQANRRGLKGNVLLTAIVESEHRYLRSYINHLMRALEEAANFTTNELEVAKEYGVWNEKNKTWSGAVGLIVTRKVDLVTSWIVMTSQRLSYIDFTVPLKKTEMVLCIKEPNDPKEITIYGYMQPFTSEVWIAIILLSIAVHCLLTFIKMNTNKSYTCFDFIKDFFYIWGSYCKQGLPEFPKRRSARMVYTSIFLFASLIMTVYSACLVSSVALFEPRLPFKTLTGFVKDGSYKLTVLRDSSEYDFFRNSNRSIWKRMNKLMMKSKDLPTSTYDAWNMMCKDKVAFYGYDLFFHRVKKKPMCSLFKIKTGRYSTFAMILRKNSPYTKIINHYLIKFKDSGVLDYIDSKFYKTTVSSKYEYQYNAVRIQEIYPLLFIAMGGILLSSTILVFERIYFWYYKLKAVFASRDIEIH